MVNLLRTGLVRNLGNITAPRLFTRAYAGTKLLIEDYITQVCLAIEHVTQYPTSISPGEGLTTQTKLDLLHDARQAFGRSALILQGGSIFGLCHIGVVKALHLRGLLPRIISGTATGALIAALVGVHDEQELLGFLSGEAIDLSAFDKRSREAATSAQAGNVKHGLFSTFVRRLRRFQEQGIILDAQALGDCVRANVGDLTFTEAYRRTRRVLNITVSSTNGTVPNLLNYLTAPNVLIWSAAVASNIPDASQSPVPLYCKEESGNVVKWSSAQDANFRPYTHTKKSSEREGPLARIAELFNVNHFVVSQARPYIAPFLRSDLNSPKPRYAGPSGLTSSLVKIALMEVQHRLHQLDSLGYLAPNVRYLVLDEDIPGPSLTLVPEVRFTDYLKLLENPTKTSIDYWVLKGEKSVWPAIGALKIRCAVEVELDRAYQLVRRRKPFDATPSAQRGAESAQGQGARKRKRLRAHTVDEIEASR